MKHFLIFLATTLILTSCIKKQQQQTLPQVAESETADSTLYGVCGDGTMMHTLELITGMKDTLEISLLDEEADEPTAVVGGLMAGDRMAVTVRDTEEGLVAQRVINITSLLGRWSSLDKNFEFTEDGHVNSFLSAENSTWTTWRILNGQLLLNRDTFDLMTIDADTLEMENRHGIFLFRRVKNVPAQQ